MRKQILTGRFMGRLILASALGCFFSIARAQKSAGIPQADKRSSPETAQLMKRLSRSKPDTALVNTYGKLSSAYYGHIVDSAKSSIAWTQALWWADRQLTLADKLNWKQGKAEAMYNAARTYDRIGNWSRLKDLLQKAAGLSSAPQLSNKMVLLTADMYFHDRQQYEKGVELITKALPGIEATGDKATLNVAYQMRAVSGLGKGDLRGYLYYILKALSTFSPTDTGSGHIRALEYASQGYRLTNDLPHALDAAQQAGQLEGQKKYGDGFLTTLFSNIYTGMGSHDKAFEVNAKALKIAAAAADTGQMQTSTLAMAWAAYYMGDYDHSISLYNQVLTLSTESRDHRGTPGLGYNCYMGLAEDYFAQKNYAGAIGYLQRMTTTNTGLESRIAAQRPPPEILGRLYLDAPDSVLKAAGYDIADRYRKAADIFDRNINDRFLGAFLVADIYRDLSRAYEKMQDPVKALEAYKKYIATKDTLDKLHDKNDVIRRETEFHFARREDSIRYRQLLASNQLLSQLKLSNQQKNIDELNYQKTQARLQAEQSSRSANEQKLKATQKEQALAGIELRLQKTELSSRKSQGYYMMAGIAALVLISAFVGRNYYNQRQANQRITSANLALNQQREEISFQRDQLSVTITDLKAAQQQLIQSEKMASLGELTAGIAHEIQNPLNFVNNFSEVSIELLQELREEAQAGHTADVLAIADDLTQNLDKVHQHGKRADSIVKGMLEHSRTGSGIKESTDLNKLADEYLRLAYHGQRARDKSFNAEILTHFDESLPLVNAIPQDMGRVLLNLFNNAFYAVNEKAKTAGAGYIPTVEVATACRSSHTGPQEVLIIVRDNGAGIPGPIKDKIMQPFFTTKPTGQGTGLGLSLSYDIITKGHAGHLTLNSAPGEGAEFTVRLPA